jgi:hypothetical protein
MPVSMAFLSCGIAFFSTLALYLTTMYPDMAGGDTGELTAASVLGGVPHPPGYPLYAMLGRAFVESSPFGGNPARKLNLLSCLYGAVASALIHWSVLRRTKMDADVSAPAAWAGMSTFSAGFNPGAHRWSHLF